MKVELFHVPGCGQCAAAEAGLKAVAEQTVGALDWRKVNVLDELDHAVELGVLTLPAIVIEGELAFLSLPTPRQLRSALLLHTIRRK
jgi:thioredoxin 1